MIDLQAVARDISDVEREMGVKGFKRRMIGIPPDTVAIEYQEEPGGDWKLYFIRDARGSK